MSPRARGRPSKDDGSVVDDASLLDAALRAFAELDEYVESMRGRMTVNEQTRSFQAFLTGDTGGPDAASLREQLEGRFNLRLSMSLMPDWARHLTGTWHTSHTVEDRALSSA